MCTWATQSADVNNAEAVQRINKVGNEKLWSNPSVLDFGWYRVGEQTFEYFCPIKSFCTDHIYINRRAASRNARLTIVVSHNRKKTTMKYVRQLENTPIRSLTSNLTVDTTREAGPSSSRPENWAFLTMTSPVKERTWRLWQNGRPRDTGTDWISVAILSWSDVVVSGITCWCKRHTFIVDTTAKRFAHVPAKNSKRFVWEKLLDGKPSFSGSTSKLMPDLNVWMLRTWNFACLRSFFMLLCYWKTH